MINSDDKLALISQYLLYDECRYRSKLVDFERLYKCSKLDLNGCSDYYRLLIEYEVYKDIRAHIYGILKRDLP